MRRSLPTNGFRSLSTQFTNPRLVHQPRRLRSAQDCSWRAVLNTGLAFSLSPVHLPINSSNMSNCEQIAIYLVGHIAHAIAVRLRPEGENIVTSRVARSSPDLLRIDLAFCCEYGSADLEVCYTSNPLGPHRCHRCPSPWSRAERGAKPNAIADEGAACRLSQWHLVGVFTGRDKSTDAIHPVVRGECV